MTKRSLGSSKRWGEKILLLPTGTWYWSKELQDISYVPYGGRNRVLRVDLRASSNHPEGALRRALNAHRDYILGNEAGQFDLGH